MGTISRKDVESAVAKGVQTTCRARRIMNPKRQAIFCHSIVDAVIAQLPQGQDLNEAGLKRLTEQQIALLKQSLDTLPKRLAEEKARLRALQADSRTAVLAGETDQQAEAAAATVVAARSMEEKLADSREVMTKLIRVDCVQLGLLTPERAEQVCRHLAGKTPEQAEQDVVTEIRNNLHQQIRKIIRKLKGGPWKSVKQQDELRLEIASTGSLQSVIKLTRHLFRERDTWEKQHARQGIRSLLKGRLKFS